MSHLLFATPTLANARNAAEALARGCNGSSTLYWWAMAPTDSGQWALLVEASTPGALQGEPVWPPEVLP